MKVEFLWRLVEGKGEGEGEGEGEGGRGEFITFLTTNYTYS